MKEYRILDRNGKIITTVSNEYRRDRAIKNLKKASGSEYTFEEVSK